MIASLPMYCRPSNRAAYDRLWALIRYRLRSVGIAAPALLDHEIDHMAGWAHPDLVLGQICNLPYRARFRGKVTIIGAAHYELRDCAPGYYNSVFVAREDGVPADFAGHFVCNDLLSNSGYGVPQHWARQHGFQFTVSKVTGSHDNSIAAVAQGHAGIAAIDAQTWWMAQSDNPETEKLQVIGRTHTTPGMTFITSAGRDPAPFFDAIDAAIRALPAKDRDLLNLRGIVSLPQSAYDIPLPPQPQAIPA